MNSVFQEILHTVIRLIQIQGRAAQREAERAAARMTQGLVLRVIAAIAAAAGTTLLLIAFYESLLWVMPAPGALALTGGVLLVIALITWLTARAAPGDR